MLVCMISVPPPRKDASDSTNAPTCCVALLVKFVETGRTSFCQAERGQCELKKACETMSALEGTP